MFIGFLQFKPSLGRVEENLRRVVELLNHAQEGSVVLLPEMWQCGFDYEGMQEHAKKTAYVLDAIKELSLSKKIAIAGTYPVLEDNRLYNMAVVVYRGSVVYKRPKVKLFPLYEEPKHFSAGEENPTFELEGLKVGILVCFELRFGAMAWELKKKGVELLLVPAMWGAKRKEHWQTLTKARAIELQAYVVACNAWGKVGEEEYGGSSAIYGPWGDVLAFSEKGDRLCSAPLDKREIEKVRRYLPVD